jgi:hypothetical protein
LERKVKTDASTCQCLVYCQFNGWKMNVWCYFVLSKGMLNETYFVEVSVLLYCKFQYTLLLFL